MDLRFVAEASNALNYYYYYRLLRRSLSTFDVCQMFVL